MPAAVQCQCLACPGACMTVQHQFTAVLEVRLALCFSAVIALL